MPATTFRVTLSNGVVATRTSKTKTYTHALVATKPSGHTGVLSWHTSEALGHKASRSLDARAMQEDGWKITVIAID